MIKNEKDCCPYKKNIEENIAKPVQVIYRDY